MTIICEDVKNPALIRKASYKGATEFVYATLDPKTEHLPFPKDYKYSSCFLPKKYSYWADRIHNFKIQSDDVWTIGFPKSGTTWLQNIVWQLMDNLDFEAPVRPSIFHWLEHAILYEKKADDTDSFKAYIDDLDKRFDQYNGMKSPRLFKSHLPAHLLPKEIWEKKSKVIYITRNPKDIIVSMYHMFINIVTAYSGSFDDMCDAFANDHFIYAPFYDNVLSYWQLQHFDNVLFLTYEDLIKDQFNGVKRISEFLGYSYSDEQLRRLTEHVSFENMKKQHIPTSTPALHGVQKRETDYEFCRKGKVGGYRDEMNDKLVKRFDEWSAKEMKKTGLRISV